MTSPVDLESVLQEWGRSAREHAATSLPAQTSIATLLRPAQRRRRWAIGAVIAVTAVVSVALALFASRPTDRHTSTGPVTTPPPSTIPCALDFGVDSAGYAPSAPSVLTIRLRYRGHADCLLGSGPPGLLLVSSHGAVFGSLEQLARGGGYRPPTSRRTVVVRPGDTASFTVANFHNCLSTPNDTYTLRVALDTSIPPTTVSGVAVPIGHLEPSALLCLTYRVGAASPLTVSAAPPTALPS